MPRAAKLDEVVVARVTVGELPNGAVVAVRTASGHVAGTIVAREPRHTIPIPGEAMKDGRVELLFEVRQKGSAPRKPTPAEVVSAKVDFVPAARRD